MSNEAANHGASGRSPSPEEVGHVVWGRAAKRLFPWLFERGRREQGGETGRWLEPHTVTGVAGDPLLKTDLSSCFVRKEES